MPEWQGKSRGNTLGYKIFVGVCKTLGLKPAYLLLRFVALYYFIFSKKSSEVIYSYFRLRHGYGRGKALKSLYKNYYCFGQTLIDKMVVSAGIENQFTFHFDGEENLREIANTGKGGILLSGHVGNWDVAGHFLHRLDTTIHIVLFDGEHQQIKDYLNELAGKRSFNIIVIRDDLSHVFAINDALQKNELVCIHADRFIEKDKTSVQQFLGADARFPIGPFRLAAGFNVPVSIVFAFKESTSHYHFYGSKIIIKAEAESKAAYMDRLMRTFVVELEEKVKKYPEQWFNYYNFWMN